MYASILPPEITHEHASHAIAQHLPDDELKSIRDKWIAYTELYDRLSIENLGVPFLWDAKLNEFIYISHKAVMLTGYAASSYLGNAGMGFSLRHIHPLCSAAAHQMMKILYEFRLNLKTAGVKSAQFSASFDYRFMRQDGSYFYNLQHCREVETHADGSPQLVLNYHFDISHLKHERKQTLIIKIPGKILIYHYQQSDNQLKTINPISKTEFQILERLAVGLETKEIARLLFKSPHTIDTHRRHLLNKLNCIDTTALVTYSRMVGLL